MSGAAKVLVVDDTPHNVKLLADLLEIKGYAVATAVNGEEALAKVAADPPDLVLLDVMMPHVDGWEMLRRVQDRYGAGAIPVVMFSGQLDEQAQQQATTSGAQGFVGKPFDLHQLIEQTKQIAPV
jgi:CheY-like chemotaxis protein